MTPAGTSNELDVQNEWEENTHTHIPGSQKVYMRSDFSLDTACMIGYYQITPLNVDQLIQEMEAPIAYSVHQQLCKHRMTGSRSSTEDSRQISEDRPGPYISSVQPVDQYEFKSRDWSDHR